MEGYWVIHKLDSENTDKNLGQSMLCSTLTSQGHSTAPRSVFELPSMASSPPTLLVFPSFSLHFFPLLS